jgi:hypothetical protein
MGGMGDAPGRPAELSDAVVDEDPGGFVVGEREHEGIVRP